MLIKQHLNLLAIQYNSPKLKLLSDLITTHIWNSGVLNKEDIKKLNIKCSSPKLSKVLLAIGLENKIVSMLLGGQLKSQLSRTKITSVVNSDADILNQSNSIYFTSCQTTNSKLKDYISVYSTGVAEDLKIARKNELFLWVVGDNYDIDKRGFISRAKLRTMYYDVEYTKIAGLFVDDIYGTASLLMDNVRELQDWWNDYCLGRYNTVTPIYVSDSISRTEDSSFFLPSASYGYQDNLSKGENSGCAFKLIEPSKGSFIKSAYKTRKKENGVYFSSLSEVVYNPQNYKFQINEQQTKKWRGLIDQQDRKIFKYIEGLLKGNHTKIKVRKWAWVREYTFGEYVIYVHNREGINIQYIYYDNKVISNNEKLGFYRAEKLPIYRERNYYEEDNNYYLLVQRDMPEQGYIQAEELPHLWMKIEGGWRVVYPNNAQMELGYARAVNIN